MICWTTCCCLKILFTAKAGRSNMWETQLLSGIAVEKAFMQQRLRWQCFDRQAVRSREVTLSSAD